MSRSQLGLALLLVATFAIRAIRSDQPIVENYVGRQIPTAMVARHLEQGGGFLHPQLDTGPFPNLFLVEPPIYAQLVVAVRSLVGFDWETTGRLVSATATALGAWGLFGLVRRREGTTVAFLALASFGIFPVMIRYGRAFQPDALMLGCVLAGLRGWDECEASGKWEWGAVGGVVLATGLALKITVAWALIPFVLIVRRWPIGWRIVVSAAMVMPAIAWYLVIWEEVARPGSGSLAASDNARLWLRSLSWEAWLRFSTYENLARGLVVRSFTPVGFVLGGWGLMASGTVDRLWKGWAIGCGLAILGLAAKWHHAYYWMVVAPLVSVGVARGLVNVAKRVKFGRPLAAVLGSFFLAICLVQSASTWQTPAEWRGLVEAADLVASITPDDQLVVAPEAVLYYANRRGYRLEFDPKAAKRAAGEWGVEIEPDPPLALTELYARIDRQRAGKSGHRSHPRGLLVADVGSSLQEPRRWAWREAIRKRPNTTILFDRPDYLIAELR